MRKLLVLLIFICTMLTSVAQTNFVKNPSFEKYDTCPSRADQLVYANYWRGVIDSTFHGNAEYFNVCSNSLMGTSQHVPNNPGFYQYPLSGNGMIGATFYYDKTPPPPFSLPSDYRDNVQGHLFKNLEAGSSYCVSFWVNSAEASGYAHNKIGAYLDDGSINSLPQLPGSEITVVTPQVYTDSIIKDTMNWTKIQGTFVAIGNETHISIGNFFTNAATTTIVTNYRFAFEQSSYYLIDDVSVVAIDAKANAGPDRWVAIGSITDIGPVEDSTARGMDCHWYYKGSLIDSGNVITVNAASSINQIDTYVVVQNVCGTITRDTMLLKTTSLGIPLLGGARGGFSIYPNPSNGTFTITNSSFRGTKQSDAIHATVYDLLGRTIHHQNLTFTNGEAILKLNLPSATYILALSNDEGTVKRERIVIK